MKMTPEQFREYGRQAIDWVADYLANPERYPVLPPVKPGELTDALPACGPEQLLTRRAPSWKSSPTARCRQRCVRPTRSQ